MGSAGAWLKTLLDQETAAHEATKNELNNLLNEKAAEAIEILHALGWEPCYSHPGGVVGVAQQVREQRDAAIQLIQCGCWGKGDGVCDRCEAAQEKLKTLLP